VEPDSHPRAYNLPALWTAQPPIPSLLLRDKMDGAWRRPFISSQFPGYEWVQLYFHSPYMPPQSVQGLLKLYFTLQILSTAKAAEGSGPRPSGTGLLSWSFPGRNERNYKRPVRINCVLAKIQIMHLPLQVRSATAWTKLLDPKIKTLHVLRKAFVSWQWLLL
jgi:hypothetical protein